MVGPKEDADVKSFRKFFFGYLTECLALMRTIESMEFASGVKQGGKKKPPGSENHNTVTQGGELKCLMEGCDKVIHLQPPVLKVKSAWMPKFCGAVF